MSMTLSEGNQSFAYQAIRMMSTPSVLATLNHRISFTLDPTTRRSKCGTGEVWEMAEKLVFSLATPKA